MTIRTRFAPSPTGVLHIGSVRTALFNWLYAKRMSGQFVLRIEDTDRERSKAEHTEAILDGMSWLGLTADEGPFYQSQRGSRYTKVCQTLIESGNAYHCYCSKAELDDVRQQQIATGEKTRYNGKCRDGANVRSDVSPVVRFRNPTAGSVVVDDLIKGRVEFSNSELDDLVIMRSDGSPTYNFTVVVDDYDMEISHVIRGDDHLSNTPRQMNMLAAIGINAPVYAHVPMILGEDGAKLSKRHGAVDIRDYREAGYLPEAVNNYLVRLGWSHGDKELFSMAELVELFDIRDVNASASTINPKKLDWINQNYIGSASADQLVPILAAQMTAQGIDTTHGPQLVDVVEAYRERARTLAEMAEKSRYCFEDFPEIDAAAAKKHLRPVVGDAMTSLLAELTKLKEWKSSAIATIVEETAAKQDMNMGKLGQPFRVAITGGGVSPPIDVTAELVGRERTIRRLEKAINFIQERKLASGQ